MIAVLDRPHSLIFLPFHLLFQTSSINIPFCIVINLIHSLRNVITCGWNTIRWHICTYIFNKNHLFSKKKKKTHSWYLMLCTWWPFQGAVHEEDPGTGESGQGSPREAEIHPRQPRAEHATDEDVEGRGTTHGGQTSMFRTRAAGIRG